MRTTPSNLTALAAVLRKYDIDPSNIPAINGIFEDGYVTLHAVYDLDQWGDKPPHHEFHEWPSDECASEVLTILYGVAP